MHRALGTVHYYVPVFMISTRTGLTPLMMNWMPIAPRRRAMTFEKTARPRSPMMCESGTAASRTTYETTPTLTIATTTANFCSIEG